MDSAAYEQTGIVRDFATRDALTPAEVAALGEVWSQARGDVLDVGVGGGRTTGYLLGVARSYHGIDISEAMVTACRRRYPQANIALGDARTLSAHDDGSIDLVLFSFNGIDYVDYGERRQVLAAAHRVLRPGGAIVYSSHNLRVLRGALPPVRAPALAWTPDPMRLALRLFRHWRARRRRSANRRRLGARQYFADGHALVNDEAYDHALLTIYVDPEHERTQLQAAGFVNVTLVDFMGRYDPDRFDDPWVYYIGYKLCA
jgi:SAM-dependent methyltransferase